LPIWVSSYNLYYLLPSFSLYVKELFNLYEYYISFYSKCKSFFCILSWLIYNILNIIIQYTQNMTIDRDFFNKIPLQKIICRKLKKIAEQKWIKTWDDWIEKWKEKNIKLDQWDLSGIFNWKKGVASEKLIKIADTIWVTEKELEKIVAEAKMDEIRIYYWEDLLSKKIYTIEEALEIIAEKEWLTDEQIQEVKKAIEFEKFKGKKTTS
jgi:hypothetical protein